MAQLVRPEALTLDRQEALGYVGYSGQVMSEDLLQRFEQLASACETTLEPVGVWDVFARAESETCAQSSGFDYQARSAVQAQSYPGVQLVDGPWLAGADIANHLTGAKEVVLMACTLGAKSEHELRKYMALGSVDGVLYGACASALVESLANAVETSVVDFAAARGLRTNFRYSPGYGDMPLAVQPQFLRALNATTRIGLNVTPDNFLLPTKSVTAVIGLFDADAPVPGARTQCSVCQLRHHCELRKKGTFCHGFAANK